MYTVKKDSKGNSLFKGERERKDGRYEYRYVASRIFCSRFFKMQSIAILSGKPGRSGYKRNKT